jgi:hypothetical protein
MCVEEVMLYIHYVCRGSNALHTLCVLVFSIVVHNTYCVVLLFCFCSSYIPNLASFSSLSFLISPSVFSNDYYVNNNKKMVYD